MLHFDFITFYVNSYQLFVYIYVLSSYIWAGLIFYPVGIVLSIYVLAAIYYMIIKASIMFKTYLKTCKYLINDVAYILNQVVSVLKYLTPTLSYIFSLCIDLLKIYSIYKFVFYFKRIEFYIFWILIVLSYC